MCRRLHRFPYGCAQPSLQVELYFPFLARFRGRWAQEVIADKYLELANSGSRLSPLRQAKLRHFLYPEEDSIISDTVQKRTDYTSSSTVRPAAVSTTASLATLVTTSTQFTPEHRSRKASDHALCRNRQADPENPSELSLHLRILRVFAITRQKRRWMACVEVVKRPLLHGGERAAPQPKNKRTVKAGKATHRC